MTELFFASIPLSTFVSMFLNHFYQCIVTSVSAERLSHVPNHRISLTSVVNIIISKFLHHNVRKRQKVDADSFFILLRKRKMRERQKEKERRINSEPWLGSIILNENDEKSGIKGVWVEILKRTRVEKVQQRKRKSLSLRERERERERERKKERERDSK